MHVIWLVRATTLSLEIFKEKKHTDNTPKQDSHTILNSLVSCQCLESEFIFPSSCCNYSNALGDY